MLFLGDFLKINPDTEKCCSNFLFFIRFGAVIVEVS